MPNEWLPEDLTGLTLTLTAIAAFASALFHSVSGFAGALILSVALAPILGIKAVVPVVSVAMIISNSNRLWLFREHIPWPAYRAIVITALPGIFAGAYLYLHLSTRAIALILGLFLFISIPLRRVLKGREIKVGMGGLSAAGTVYGLVSGTVFGAGILLAPFYLGAGIVGEALVGLGAALGLTLNLVKSVVFGAGELLDYSLLVTGIAVGVFTIPGGLAGRAIVRRTSISIQALLVEILIFFGGCYFLYQAFTIN